MRKFLLTFFIFSIVSSLCLAQDTVKSQPLSLFIKSDKEVYEIGEEILIQIENKSNKEI